MRVCSQISFPNGQKPVTFLEPDICPACKYAIQAAQLSVSPYSDNKNLNHFAVTYLCKHCYRPFLVHYVMSEKVEGGHYVAETISVVPNLFTPNSFDPHIETISPSFVSIYNQALAAETSGLDQIAGVGYRKAMEFLIKDYLISLSPDQKETIEKMELGNCIANKVTNEKLKAVASRSVWLGNDQTHYVRKFLDRDVADMKRFIDAAVYWISYELITEEALEMEPAGH